MSRFSTIAKFDANRKRYFDGAGNSVTGCVNANDALIAGGLNYTVEKQPLITGKGIIVPDKYATVRTDTNKVLGVVGKNYTIVQNEEGFAFIEDIIKEGAQYECAGTYDDGKGSWICARTEPIKILDDSFDPYILFTNSFDGTGSIKAMFTPIRTFCSNCFINAERQASNKITIRHFKDAKDRLYIAKDTLLANSNYLNYIKSFSETMAVTTFTKSNFEDLCNILVPVDREASEAVKARAEESRNALMVAYNQDDLQNFNDTAYKALMAVSDFESHKEPARNTNNPSIYLKRVLSGMILLNTTIKYIQEHMRYKPTTFLYK